MTKRQLIILSPFAIILALALILALTSNRPANNTQPSPTAQNQSPNSNHQTPNPGFPINSNIFSTDPLSGPNQQPDQPGPTLPVTPKLVTHPDYNILYFEAQDIYSISIQNPDFNTVRPLAQQALLDHLKISPAQACELNVEISTPIFVNPSLATQIFNLSFCK